MTEEKPLHYKANSAPCAITESVRAKLLARSQFGIKKYGVSLDRTDLSRLEWMKLLQEELLDAAGYLEVLIQMEGHE